MLKFSLLSKEEIKSFKEIYVVLINKSISAGITEEERTEFLRTLMDKIF